MKKNIFYSLVYKSWIRKIWQKVPCSTKGGVRSARCVLRNAKLLASLQAGPGVRSKIIRNS